MTESNESQKSDSLNPSVAMLDTRRASQSTNGIQIDELEQFETLAVETLNHTYEITIINPRTAEVLVRGGDFFPERRMAWVCGASLGGPVLKLHGIYVGFKLEFLADGKRITTSTVRSVGGLNDRKAA